MARRSLADRRAVEEDRALAPHIAEEPQAWAPVDHLNGPLLGAWSLAPQAQRNGLPRSIL
jgi:hypothetical protein